MRGKRIGGNFFDDKQRITPADAGKTSLCALPSAHPRDHPRGCGENKAPLSGVFGQSGSPPRMRGKLSKKETCSVDDRITPADAGKTLSERLLSILFKDHPRGCGENGKS